MNPERKKIITLNFGHFSTKAWIRFIDSNELYYYDHNAPEGATAGHIEFSDILANNDNFMNDFVTSMERYFNIVHETLWGAMFLCPPYCSYDVFEDIATKVIGECAKRITWDQD